MFGLDVPFQLTAAIVQTFEAIRHIVLEDMGVYGGQVPLPAFKVCGSSPLRYLYTLLQT